MLASFDPIALASHQPMLLLFAVLAVGWLFGRMEVGGFSLGPAAVLFAGLAASGFDERLQLPEELGTFGLCLFVYAIGVGSGPGFAAAFRGRGRWTSLVAFACIAVAAITTALMAWLFGFDSPTAVGLFAGSLTNTPALAASVDSLAVTAGADVHAPVVGYSVAYPLGVLLPLMVLALASRRVAPDAGSAPAALLNRTVRLTRKAGLASVLRSLLGSHARFGRYRRGDVEGVVTDETRLELGDLVTLVGDATGLDLAESHLGDATATDLPDDRSRLDFRRIFVSEHDVVRRPLSELRLPQRFEAIITRVRRGDVDLLADRDTELELGDRVRVVAPQHRLDEVSRFFGDSFRALAEIDVLSFALGVTLGLLLGLLPIPTPIGPVKLGLAGGPLVVGLVLGRLGRTGPLVWDLPFPASMTLRQLGIVLFLAVVGTRSGASLATTLAGGHAGPLLFAGTMVTLSACLPALWLTRQALGLPVWRAFGAIAGIHTQPAVLAWASARTTSDGPSRGYAAVFPVATVTKILAAQLLLRFLE